MATHCNGWPNAHNMLWPTILQNVVLKCCDGLARLKKAVLKTFQAAGVLFNDRSEDNLHFMMFSERNRKKVWLSFYSFELELKHLGERKKVVRTLVCGLFFQSFSSVCTYKNWKENENWTDKVEKCKKVPSSEKTQMLQA